MNKMDIVEYLEENGLEDVEEVPSKTKMLVITFFYVFDEDELEAARGYVEDESEDGEEVKEWKEKYYEPFLNDIAEDNVGEIIEEITEEFDTNCRYVSYGVNEEERCEFIAVFSSIDFDIEEVLEELDL